MSTPSTNGDVSCMSISKKLLNTEPHDLVMSLKKMIKQHMNLLKNVTIVFETHALLNDKTKAISNIK